MTITQLDLPGLLLITPKRFGDERGFFMETFRRDVLTGAGVPDLLQDNHSRSVRGTLRGLHFQEPHGQGKLVRVVQGAVWDVVVDIRRGSPTFGKSHGLELSEENALQLWIPPGFAHGFCVTADSADFVYKCSEYYHPESEHTLLWNDAALGIDWPIADPVISDKDRNGKPLAELEVLPEYKA